MVSRVAELFGALIIILVGFTAVCALTYDAAQRSPSERGPVQHSTVGLVGTALEDGYTARLALSQFPLPVLGSRSGGRASAELISAIQGDLATLGFATGAVDGVDRPQLREAIRDYQAAVGLDLTGAPTTNLLDHIRSTRGLGLAVTGGNETGRDLIQRVQERLAAIGYEPGATQGVLDAKTREAIARFEADRGLPVTGEVSQQLVLMLGRERPASPN
jgi:peptidoglycan hydrolase-like protein with peptidoglycan-binding domain